jgi:hypothetical protein
MDFDNMIFPPGLIFIFRSWICEVDNKGKLQGCLLKDREDQEDLTLLVRSIEGVAGRFSCLAMFKSIQVSPMIEFNSDSRTESASENNQGSFHGKSGSFLMGLWNIASIHQEIHIYV